MPGHSHSCSADRSLRPFLWPQRKNFTPEALYIFYANVLLVTAARPLRGSCDGQHRFQVHFQLVQVLKSTRLDVVIIDVSAPQSRPNSHGDSGPGDFKFRVRLHHRMTASSNDTHCLVRGSGLPAGRIIHGHLHWHWHRMPVTVVTSH